jgi:transcriptional regulator CtsR
MLSTVKRKDLWQRLGNVQRAEVLIKAANQLGLTVTSNHGSHFTIRDPRYELDDVRGVINTVYKGVYKQLSHAIFKKMIAHGIAEDDIWKALNML